jgi:glycosyltransferase involved in cell wall biosynthesis
MSAAAHTPRASLLLLAYNQERHIEEAARGCLAQQCEALQIVLSDDASSDRTHAILSSIAATYAGPHRVVVRRNERNLGIAAHYNRLIDESCGELLITAAGDDVSLPDRVARLLAAWDATGQRADLVASHLIDIDGAGVEHGVLAVDDLAAHGGVDGWCRRRPFVIGAGHAFTRRLMRRFGPIDGAVPYEDQILVFRALASGGAATVDAPLVRYRRGGESARPVFASAAHERAWRLRRLHGEIAEREQLMRDAALAGCADQVGAALERLRVRQTYLNGLYGADSALQRLRVLFMADGPSRAWRFGKWMQATTASARIRAARQRQTTSSKSS